MKKRLLLIDGHAIVFRAYYAFPASLTTKKGEQINAVYGFASILLSVIKELKPSHITVAFDLDEPTFRHIEYVGYKAQRPEVEEELTAQIDRVKDVVKVLNIPIFEVEGFEADDVIGTLARQGNKEKDLEIVIVTGDQDAMQLINDGVKVFVPGRGKQSAKMYGEKEVRERYGLEPKQIIDLKALAGDPSDNIPGVKGVGPKTATELLKKFLTVERVYSGLDEAMKKGEISKAVGEKLADDYEEAVRGKKLTRIVTDVPISLDLKACELHDYDKKKAGKFFEELGFKSIVKRLPNDNWEQAAEEMFKKKRKKPVKKKKSEGQMGLF
jgi:DNA polymerase-1